MSGENLRDYSRSAFTNGTDVKPSSDQIKLGCMLRIADATENMVSKFVDLQKDRDRYRLWYEEGQRSAERMARRIAALRGVITKAKRTKP